MARKIFILILFIFGCGPDPREVLREQKNQVTSQVNVLADKLSRQIDENGWFIRNEMTEKDVWGNPLRISYDRNVYSETLQVSSNGPDGLPMTRDDIGAKYNLNNQEYLKAFKEAKQSIREKNIEGNSSSLTKGLVKGVFQAIEERKKR